MPSRSTLTVRPRPSGMTSMQRCIIKLAGSEEGPLVIGLEKTLKAEDFDSLGNRRKRRIHYEYLAAINGWYIVSRVLRSAEENNGREVVEYVPTWLGKRAAMLPEPLCRWLCGMLRAPNQDFRIVRKQDSQAGKPNDKEEDSEEDSSGKSWALFEAVLCVKGGEGWTHPVKARVITEDELNQLLTVGILRQDPEVEESRYLLDAPDCGLFGRDPDYPELPADEVIKKANYRLDIIVRPTGRGRASFGGPVASEPIVSPVTSSVDVGYDVGRPGEPDSESLQSESSGSRFVLSRRDLRVILAAASRFLTDLASEL